jgi:hypothetical protein
MKKIVLLPKTDTIILCLPEKWIGIPLICHLSPIPNDRINMEKLEAETEKIIAYRYKKSRKKKNKPIFFNP